MKSKLIGRPRAPAIDRIIAGTLFGTRELVTALVKDSSAAVICWRPVRAAAAMAMPTAKGHVWMTTEEFVEWVRVFYRERKGFRLGDLARDIGMAPSRRRTLLAGTELPAKVEALACAHLAAGLPLPVEADTEAFVAWFTPRFGSSRAVGDALEIAHAVLPNQLRGYGLYKGQRYARPPDVGLIRALDWVWRVGPFSPYGERPGAPAFPGQETSS